jgi:FAD/FMN-containing dehydrogenase
VLIFGAQENRLPVPVEAGERTPPRPDLQADVRLEAYGDHIYRRLAEVKAKYDPDNAFHHNKNICPG